MKRYLKTNSSRNATVVTNLLLIMSEWYYFGNRVGILKCISVEITRGCAFSFVSSCRSSRIMVKRKTFSKDNDDFGFHPKFDGQLFYGHEADNKGYVKTSLTQIKRKIISSLDETLLEDRYRLLKERSRAILNGIPIISRTVTITTNISVTVWEVERPSAMIERWIMHNSTDSIKNELEERDPFGVVVWPGSIAAAQEILNHRSSIENATVLVLGAGLGVEVQTASMVGARRVIATDINPLTLQLLQYGVQCASNSESKGNCGQQSSSAGTVETLLFDLCNGEEISELVVKEEVDVVIIADVLYNEQLATSVGERCWEILNVERPILLIVTDSQRFHGTDFLTILNSKTTEAKVFNIPQWKEVMLKGITGSGVLIDEDQTYDIKARVLCTTNEDWSRIRSQ